MPLKWGIRSLKKAMYCQALDPDETSADHALKSAEPIAFLDDPE